MSMIIKGREIVLSDYAQITAKIRNENKTVDVFWYLEKVDFNVYPYDEDNHPVDYILCVISHITNYVAGSSYPMDRMYFFMIHNEKYRYYTDPEDIKITIALKNIITNDNIYETTANNSTRYTGNHTFNTISRLSNVPIYERFNGIPEDKYQDIKNILGKDRCNSICIDTAMIQTDIGDANHPLSTTCYLYDEQRQITCKLIYPNGDEAKDPIVINPADISGTFNIAEEAIPFDISGLIEISDI